MHVFTCVDFVYCNCDNPPSAQLDHWLKEIVTMTVTFTEVAARFEVSRTTIYKHASKRAEGAQQ